MRIFNPNETNEMVQLVEQKGVFCYDYIDKFERHNETAVRPSEQFNNWLAGEDWIEANYARAQRVWKNFKFQHIGDYMRLDLLSDVAILADMFEM